MQVDEEQARPVVRVETDDDVAQVQVVVDDAGVVQAGDEPAQLFRQPQTDAGLTNWGQARKGLVDERAAARRLPGCV